MTTLDHSQFSPEMASTGFYPFRRLKSVLKERRLCDATDIIKNAKKELKILSQNGSQECFQHLYSRWQKCVFAQGAVLKEMCLK